MRNPVKVNPWTPALEYCLWQHPEGIHPTIGKYHLLCQWYSGGYGRRRYSHARAKGKHRPWCYDPLDRVGLTEPSNHKDGSAAVYMPSLVQSNLLSPKGVGDMVLCSPKILRVEVYRCRSQSRLFVKNFFCCSHLLVNLTTGNSVGLLFSILVILTKIRRSGQNDQYKFQLHDCSHHWSIYQNSTR